MGPRGGFSYFVFQQLYENRQFSRLLRLGEEFPEELATFLKDHMDLRWLHEIFLHQYSSASLSLHVLALSEDTDSIPSVDKEMEPVSAKLETSRAARKRFLFLSKIASVAGADKDAGFEARVARLDADIKIMNLQEEILNLLDNDNKQEIGQQLLKPEEMINLCVNQGSRELLLKAFDVFAWTSLSFREGNKSLLEACWRCAVNQDNWEKLYQLSSSEGWSEEETSRCLENTALFQASRRCYGPESGFFDGGFDEVLPLRCDSGSSVEAILMQHRDYSDAGKLMLIAVMMGSEEVEERVGDEVSSMK